MQGGRLLLEGVSRGALVAGFVALHDPAVLISGLYDLNEFQQQAQSSEAISVIASLKQETGGSADARKTRSLLNYAQRGKAGALILNGAQDDRTSPDQTRRLAEAINMHGGHTRVIIYPAYGHQIPVEVRNKPVDPFVQQVLGH